MKSWESRNGNRKFRTTLCNRWQFSRKQISKSMLYSTQRLFSALIFFFSKLSFKLLLIQKLKCWFFYYPRPPVYCRGQTIPYKLLGFSLSLNITSRHKPRQIPRIEAFFLFRHFSNFFAEFQNFLLNAMKSSDIMALHFYA